MTYLICFLIGLPISTTIIWLFLELQFRKQYHFFPFEKRNK
jgi:hypothetical protein